MIIKKNKKIIPLTAIILAGGKSSRISINKDKAQLKLAGEPLINWVISRLVPIIIEENIIIVGPPKKYSYFPKIVQDIFPQKGPLAGIYSGLKASPTFYNLIVGCDMPFLETELVWYMWKNISSEDIIIPSCGKDYIEPLFAIYSKRCLKIMEKNLKRDILPVRLIFPYLKVKYIKDEEIMKFDPKYLSFFNINFKKDLIKAEELIRNKEVRR